MSAACRDCRPTHQEVQEAQIPISSVILVDGNGSPPPPVPGSGQLPGEDPEAYRARYVVRREHMIEKESFADKIA